MTKFLMGDIVSCSIRLRVVTNSVRVLEYFSNTEQRSIPDYNFTSLVHANGRGSIIKPDWEVKILESGKDSDLSIDVGNRLTVVKYPATNFLSNDLEMLVIFLLSYLYQKKGVICAHAIGLSDLKKHGAMIIGEIGAGKSITALRLLLRGYGFIGNDRLLLQKNEKGIDIIGGSIPIRLRQATINRYFPELILNTVASETWSKFQFFNPEALGFQRVCTAPLRHLFRVRIVPVGKSNCTCFDMSELDGQFAIVKIYQALSYFYLDHQLVYLSAGKVYPSLDSLNLATYRWQIAKSIFDRSCCYELYGNLDWVVTKIRHLTKEVDDRC